MVKERAKRKKGKYYFNRKERKNDIKYYYYLKL